MLIRGSWQANDELGPRSACESLPVKWRSCDAVSFSNTDILVEWSQLGIDESIAKCRKRTGGCSGTAPRAAYCTNYQPVHAIARRAPDPFSSDPPLLRGSPQWPAGLVHGARKTCHWLAPSGSTSVDKSPASSLHASS